MNLLKLFSFRAQKTREFTVTVYGKQLKLSSGTSSSSQSGAQAYAERNAIVCADCGKILLPGRKVCFTRPNDSIRTTPGVLVLEHGLAEPGAAICLDCGDPIFMRGEIQENRKVFLFQSPLDKTLAASSQVTIVPDISAFRG